MRFILGGGGWPDGWSSVAPILLGRWPYYKRFPPVWVKGREATQADVEALGRFQRRIPPRYDVLSAVGKDDPAYTTQKDEYRRHQ